MARTHPSKHEDEDKYEMLFMLAGMVVFIVLISLVFYSRVILP